MSSPKPGIDDVVTSSGEYHVVSGVTDQPVAAAARGYLVVATACPNLVVTRQIDDLSDRDEITLVDVSRTELPVGTVRRLKVLVPDAEVR